MRMLMKVTIPVEKGSAGIRDGSLPRAIQEAMERLKPEAAYFTPLGGTRTALFVFDMQDSSQLPAIAEPFFSGFAAAIEIMPCMNGDDLQKGLGQLG